jgi:hypothetical protein
MIQASPMLAAYGTTVDRESAYEILRGKPAPTQAAPGAIPAPPASSGNNNLNDSDWGNSANQQPQPRYEPAPQARQPEPAPQQSGGIFGTIGDLLGGTTGPRGGHREGVLESAAKSAARALPGRLAVKWVGRFCVGSWGRFSADGAKQTMGGQAALAISGPSRINTAVNRIKMPK